MKKAIAILSALALFAIIGCTQNTRVNKYGGTMTINLPPNTKLLTVCFDHEDDLWYSTRPMLTNETPETITMHEKSKWGMMQGTVNFVESKQ